VQPDQRAFEALNYILLRIIRNPLQELTKITKDFKEGNLTLRSAYVANNELGDLSLSFNKLATRIERNLKLNEDSSQLTGLMLKEEDPNKFFGTILNSLCTLTGSQIAAVYLLNDEESRFDCFNSIGLDGIARKSFAANSPEGEFGFAFANHQIQHLKNLPEGLPFIFNTASASFVPREIITIPILSLNKVVGFITLATLNSYGKHAVNLIHKVQDALCARVEGILAFKKISEFSGKLYEQNKELEQQSKELTMQSAELSEYNTELELQKQQLDKASQLKSTFLSNMSHELRTPLNSVIALSGVLSRKLKKQIPDDEYSYLEVIERNGKHLLSLINNILDISRIEAGREETEIAEFNVSSLLDEVIQMIHPQASQKDIELSNVSENEKIIIESDSHKCRHILQNLIGNAVKFTESGKVEVSVMEVASGIEIVVRDTGIGISEEHQHHIFDEFRQADGSTSRKFGGTGLGLAIAKKYANLLGGNISVQSTFGDGSKFTLFLPTKFSNEKSFNEGIAEGVHKYQIKPNFAATSPDKKNKTILIVEDSEPAIIQVKDILEETGYQILVARDGAEALQIISDTIPDAVILDLMLPGIDGFEVLGIIRNAELTAGIPVLVLTARQISKDELKFLKRNNIHQLVQKGDVNREELLRAIEAMIPSIPENNISPQTEFQVIEGKPVVLVVEDNPDNMITAKALLSDSFTVLEARDGYEGISIAKKHIPNLILMDIALPGMDGIEAFKIIKNDPNLLKIPVIALTASAMNSDREAILTHGFDSYIAKPLDQEAFFKTINEVLYGK